MNIATVTSSRARSRTSRSGSMHRIGALARAEAVLLRRNPMALLMALTLPAAMVLMVRTSVPAGDWGVSAGAVVVTSLTGFTLVFGVYYNLVTALVARREGLVLKRLRSGEIGDAEILAGAAAPGVVVAWVQIAVGVAVAATALGLDRPTNPLLVMIALVLGTAVFVLLAAASTAVTKTVEMAQLTTTPVLLVSMLLSNLMVPRDAFPESLQRIAQILPLTPVVDLLRLGLAGTTPAGSTVDLAGTFGPALLPVAILLAWVHAGMWATRRWFRWEPRR